MPGQRALWNERLFGTACSTGAASFRQKVFTNGIKAKKSSLFERYDSPVLFMAGCYNQYDQDRFVILTTDANPSVSPVHERMPLILEPDELESWVLDDRATEFILHKTPVMLKSSTEYKQMSLFL